MSYPRSPPEAVTRTSINVKITISEEPLVKIDPIFVPEYFLYEAILIFRNFVFQDGRRLPVLKVAQNMKMTMTEWILTRLVSKRFLHWVVSKLNKNRPVKMASVTKNSKI